MEIREMSEAFLCHFVLVTMIITEKSVLGTRL